jgi:hypothetical protein
MGTGEKRGASSSRLNRNWEPAVVGGGIKIGRTAAERAWITGHHGAR